MTFQGRCKNSQERCKTISGEVHTSPQNPAMTEISSESYLQNMNIFNSIIDSYEMHIEFVNFVIAKLEYCQKSGYSLSIYDCLETELKALCCVVV
jgi:hypothetical protein